MKFGIFFEKNHKNLLIFEILLFILSLNGVKG